MAQGAWSQSLGFSCGLGGWVCAWPRAAPIPPRPIPNRVVPGASAGKYCAGNRVGGEAAARTPRPPTLACADRRGVEQRQLVGLITQRSRVRIPPPLPAEPWENIPRLFFLSSIGSGVHVLPADPAGL